MKDELKNILDQFDNNKILFQDFASSLTQLLKSLLGDSGIRPHQFDCRIKQVESLKKKIAKKDYKYKNLSEITDICGLRIVTYFEDDIDKVANIFTTEFEIDQANSVDKRIVEADRFGYRSLHYVFQLKDNRTKLPEYKRFKELKAEIQIRSILQHSWAEIEHDLGYKGEKEIPPSAKRTFYRVAALLEQADIEFVKLKQQILQHEKEVAIEIKQNPVSVKIDKSSLISFVKTSIEIQEFEESFNSKSMIRGEVEADFVASAIPDLERLKINNIKELEDVYNNNIEKIRRWIQPRFESFNKTQRKEPLKFLGGASIHWLCTVLQENGG